VTSAGRGKRQGAGTFASSRLEQLKPYMNEAGMGVASHPSPPDEFRKVDEIPTPMPAFSLAFLYISGVQAAESEYPLHAFYRLQHVHSQSLPKPRFDLACACY